MKKPFKENCNYIITAYQLNPSNCEFIFKQPYKITSFKNVHPHRQNAQAMEAINMFQTCHYTYLTRITLLTC